MRPNPEDTAVCIQNAAFAVSVAAMCGVGAAGMLAERLFSLTGFTLHQPLDQQIKGKR